MEMIDAESSAQTSNLEVRVRDDQIKVITDLLVRLRIKVGDAHMRKVTRYRNGRMPCGISTLEYLQVLTEANMELAAKLQLLEEAMVGADSIMERRTEMMRALAEENQDLLAMVCSQYLYDDGVLSVPVCWSSLFLSATCCAIWVMCNANVPG